MTAGDQAAGLRRWAEQFGRAEAPSTAAPAPAPQAPPRPEAEPATLLVIGLPGPRSAQGRRVLECLTRWQVNGHRWVGDPARWKVVALEADSPHLDVLASQQPRWALWVEDDADGFRRSFRTLRRLREQGGPQRLLVLHGGIASHAGLLRNLQQAAAAYLDMQLLLLPEQAGDAC
ncbi:conserved hypothetical protein [Pseudomonas sp. OF001]|uniref:hypothetical protein n=1 Tax=Pseudomonas sp. OF001 TaxID=2772300 RepID=UPI00191A3AB9|nr:hypothetical protein [Pseudomonas sp. OF001]CAD5379300.1 conserved hypothetical protein [Pseudomonas sp. OF001]